MTIFQRDCLKRLLSYRNINYTLWGSRLEKLKTVLLLVTACLIDALVGSAVTFAVMQRSYSISNFAKVKAVGVEVYVDPELAVRLTEINWGSVEPGESKTFTAYIQNAGNSPITLSLDTESWVPGNASSMIQVSWNYSGKLVDAWQAVMIEFELHVDFAVSGIDTFSFTMVITGSG
jgi:hypothetical protein